MTVAECEQFIAEGHFAPGSMLPKVQAAMTFAKLGSGRKAIIASLYNAVDALKGNSGTAVTLE
jgi:carbamate kinase